jgi:Amt family ammonium transporter
MGATATDLESPVLVSLLAARCTADQTILETTDAVNTNFLLTCAYMVFLMQAGFAMLCAGSVRSKNTMNILLKNVIDVAAGAVAYYLFGWGFAYGPEGNNPFIAAGDHALYNYSDWEGWLFQWAFAAAAATIVSGAMAERTAFSAYLIYSVVLTGFVYPVVVHWVWDGRGWLAAFPNDINDTIFKCGMIDFAGCGVVHMTGGFAALAGAYFVGPRLGRFTQDGEVADMPGHSATLVVLGTFLLWFGWYGFNPGSQLAIGSSTDAEIVGRCAVTTTLSGAAAGLTTLFARKIQSGTWDLVTSCNGALAGLVAITAGPSVLQPWAALIAGAIGALVFLGSKWLVLYKLKVDDPVDAIALHGFTGAWGLIVVGLLADKTYVGQVYSDATDYGIFYGGEGKLLGAEIVGIICIFLWVMSTQGLLFFVLSKLGLLRASADEEMLGLDASEHGGSAYNYGDAKEKKEQI